MNTPDPVIDETGAEPPIEPAGKCEVTSDLPEAPPDADVPDRPAPVMDAHAIADRLRAEFSEIATVAAQAARLGIAIDAADAKYRLSPNATVTGDEGAETAIAVLLDPVDATATDETGLIAARGPLIVSKAALGFDASVNAAAKKAAKHTQLAAAGLVAREAA